MDRPGAEDGDADRLSLALAGREVRLAAILSVAWSLVVFSYALGFLGLVGGPPRPVLLAEIAALAGALLLPLALVWLAALVARRASLLRSETARLAALIEGLRGTLPLRATPQAADLAAALVQAARQATEEERAEIRVAIARLEDRSRGLAEADGARAAERAEATAERAEIRAALARLEARAKASLAERAQFQAEARAAAEEREELRRALHALEAAAGRRPEDGGAREAERRTAEEERSEIRRALARMEEAADRGAEERAALFAAIELHERERGEIRAVLSRLEARGPGDGAAGLAADLDGIRAALARMEEGAAAMLAERETLVAEAIAAQGERDEIRAALARMEARALESEALLQEREAIEAQREELRAALLRMEQAASARAAEEAARQAELLAAVAEREELRLALSRMEERAGAPGPGEPATEGERADIRAALFRLEARAEALAADRRRAEAEREAAAEERAELRAALARLEERAAAASEARELLVAGREAAARERDEIRAAFLRLEARAAAAAEDAALVRAEREAAARERDELRAALAAFGERAIGTVEDERAALAETLARLEAQQLTSAEALAALLDRRAVSDEIARLRRRGGAAPAAAASGQADLPLSPAPGAATEPAPDWPDVLRALNFPRDEADREGFASLRRARRDRTVAECLQAAEDVLTLLSQDGLYMDDLVPEPVAPELWLRFADGERGPALRALGAIADETALAIARGRVRGDAVFRDASLHFLRRFDRLLRRLAAEAGEEELHALAGTRTGRAFMLLARVHGVFE